MFMRKTVLLAMLAGALPTFAVSMCALPACGLAQTWDEIVHTRNTDNVLSHSMGLDRKSYSPLRQINKENVRRLVPVWSTSLMNDWGELSAPAVYDGVIYAINGKWTFALDAETGRQLWRTPVETEAGVDRHGFNRGAPLLYSGKLFRVTVDNHLVALDMKTGKVIWNQKFAEAKEGYYSTGAPMIANGVLMSGMGGGESTTRGFIDGWDPDTGKKLWRRYTIPAPGEPGSETWPADSDAWTRGGGPTWRTGSYDPELDVVYWGTGNAEPYDPRPRGALDSLYTSSILALRPKTGEVVCFYQYTPNDIYDVDGTDEQVLADLAVDGRTRKVMIQTNKNGFMYVLDRTTCKPIAVHAYTKVNWASGIDKETGRPVLTDVYTKFLAGEEVEIFPSRGTNAVPIAFNPNTGLVYVSTWNLPRLQKLAASNPQTTGSVSTGVVARPSKIAPGEVTGAFVAFDPITGDRKWEVPLIDLPSAAGMLATDGGLIFTGKATGEFVALDADTGKTLWQFKVSSSVNATAITYTHNGRQYVSVASGLGGSVISRLVQDKVPTGGSLWTFALMPE
jgi:alcohol dehydrogenase (cytochrome c)